MNLHPVSTAAVGLLIAGALVACGQPPQAQQETPTQIWHEVVLCARAHGDPSFPDPQSIDSQGRAKFPPNTAMPPPATLQACQSVFDRLPPAARGNPVPDIQMEVRFAQCMREHGLSDWPDPDANGDYPLPPDLITRKTGPVWDRIKAGWDACKQYNPSGHISVSHS
jgi:hypothetical protein